MKQVGFKMKAEKRGKRQKTQTNRKGKSERSEAGRTQLKCENTWKTRRKNEGKNDEKKNEKTQYYTLHGI